jgi:hypothetical protein
MNGPFERVLVDHLVQGQTRVTWTLARGFCDPDPWLLKLQWGHTGGADADDWADVADFVPDVGVLVDPESRDDLGVAWRIHYRVVLRTPRGDYTSRPTPILTTADTRRWLQARAIVRRERLRMDQADVARGWLLKRKREGPRPDQNKPTQAVTSFLTGEVVRGQDRRTVGTEFTGGYYAPIPFRVDFRPAGTHEERDGAKARGTVDDRALMQYGRVLLDPPLAEGDVFVAEGSDERFYIHDVTVNALQGRIPLTADVNLRLAPRSDVIYTLPVPDVDPFPEEAYCG